MRSCPPFALLGFTILVACADPDTTAPIGPRDAALQARAAAEFVATFDYSRHLIPLGFSERLVPLDNAAAGSGVFNSDLAFWGNLAFQGTYEGFRIIDISEAPQPRELVNFTDCVQGTTRGNQGDVVVWDDILVRSWNSPAPAGGSACGGIPVPEGAEGLHIFDISDPANPVAIAFVDLPCGSHTATGVPDPANNRFLVYSVSASASCLTIDIVEVPLNAPHTAALVRSEASDRPCTESAIILGDAMRLACTGGSSSSTGAGNGFTMWSLDPADGASLTDPALLYSQTTGGIDQARGISFTWDGHVIVVSHEPGGGAGAQCEETDNPLERTVFFHDVESGASLGQFVLPRPQMSTENCTWALFNIVPQSGRYVLVGGNFQSGLTIVDFTNPATATEVAFADPAPLIDPNPPAGIELGGAWSSYWYNGNIYYSDITRGMIVWKLASSLVGGARRLDHLNPHAQENTIR